MTAAAPALSPQEQQNIAQAIDYSHVQSIAEIWPIVAERFPYQTALEDPHGTPQLTLTYGVLAQQIQQFLHGILTIESQNEAHSGGHVTNVLLIQHLALIKYHVNLLVCKVYP